MHEGQVTHMRQANGGGTIDHGVVERGDKRSIAVITKFTQSSRLCCHLLGRNLAGSAEANNPRHIQRAGSKSPLVSTTEKNWRQAHAWLPPNKQRAAALRAV